MVANNKWALGFQELKLYSLMRYLAVRLAVYADFSVPPRLQTVRTNTTWASQSITLENEVLGSSNSEKFISVTDKRG